MAYALDDGWDNCGPVARAGNACFGLYVRCGIWVARNLTDGFIPGEIAASYGSPEQARKLVDVGLWEAVDGGYLAGDYLTLNPTSVKVRARQRADAERKAKWREKLARQRGTRDETQESGGSHGGTDGRTPFSPATPKGVGRRPPATRGGASGAECQNHVGQSAHNCGPCRSEALAGDTSEPPGRAVLAIVKESA